MYRKHHPEKNYENTVRWWIEEFKDDNVGLIIKSNTKNNSTMDGMQTEAFLKSLTKQYPDKTCKVYMLHGDLTPGQMTGLYNHPKVKALVNIAHGEGFGLPLFEAAREALPIVTIGWSGQMDFLTNGTDEYFQKLITLFSPFKKQQFGMGYCSRIPCGRMQRKNHIKVL